MAEQIYELSITLRDSDPPIWRRVAVPGGISLGQLHEIVQITMGWTNSHLHQFTGGPRVSTERRFVPLVTPLGDETGLEGEDEDSHTLAELCPSVKSRLMYMYDFGDGWEHTLEVQKIDGASPNVGPPVCLAGENACPPEDCGGVPGYEEMLEALGDPAHERHDEMMEWIGEEFDAGAFDRDEVNEVLAERWMVRSGVRARRAKKR